MRKQISKEQKSFFRYAAISSLLCLIFLFLKRDSLITWVGAAINLKHQQEQIDALERSNEELLEHIQDLKTNKDSLEKYARQTYQFAADGDDVYIVE